MNQTRHNIGVVTGAISRVVVVDCDTREDALWWWQNRPRTPLISRTGRGVHFWYSYAPTGNRARLNARGIDVRGDGGYVVAPPSIHPSGTRYEWLQQGVPPAFNPEWLKQTTDAQRPVNFEIAPGGNFEVERARSYIARIFAVSGRAGHNTTYRAACKARDFGLTEDQVLQVLTEWNETNADPPWSAKELLHKVRSAFREVVA